ncbi:hypothetical protein [Ktedonospora formicarum]|nr:hypothetical protein [Ktedonospora formicarum]
MRKDVERRMWIYRQYSQVYGPLTDEGRYGIGEQVRLIDRTQGNVMWKYVHRRLGLIYVLEDETPFPVEVKAEVIVGEV